MPEVGPRPGARSETGISRADRCVIFTAHAGSLDEARQKFRASGRSDSDALFIIKTETSIFIYLV